MKEIRITVEGERGSGKSLVITKLEEALKFHGGFAIGPKELDQNKESILVVNLDR